MKKQTTAVRVVDKRLNQAGKGSFYRPVECSQEEWADHWEKAFSDCGERLSKVPFINKTDPPPPLKQSEGTTIIIGGSDGANQVCDRLDNINNSDFDRTRRANQFIQECGGEI